MNSKFLLYLIGGVFFLPACGQQSMDNALKSLNGETVALIKPEELKRWQLEQKELVLIDARSPKEFQISHLKGSEFVDFENFEPSSILHIPKSSTVVVYCSVGYRSERIGERIKELGFKKVFNLYGGLFQWKNQGYSVVNSQNKVTDSVHVYNRLWGQYLKKGIKVYD
jgi:rhodanese-related sulfurtransferase